MCSGFLLSPNQSISSEAPEDGLGRRLQVERPLNETVRGRTADGQQRLQALIMLRIWQGFILPPVGTENHTYGIFVQKPEPNSIGIDGVVCVCVYLKPICVIKTLYLYIYICD